MILPTPACIATISRISTRTTCESRLTADPTFGFGLLALDFGPEWALSLFAADVRKDCERTLKYGARWRI